MFIFLITLWMLVVGTAIVWTEVSREVRRRNDQR